ncbi:spore coat associated protein CotJA [Anaerotignum lactatifermentans]|uniref:Spore coat associated protein CotJA n=2 Tax=Anaerotignum lactatifermentans TaxID=160404 RepID=A0ABS2GBB1_9FIRM|nr:spore coat associated protein CotJA [Anaerotignum lactatifermentans]MBM6878786.1 spore coat associated protein CotJA [Anaerotignum lactatifermentans]MBM6950273.1 spore coat associated protein CotJA [Anaerotignum lactatifermentans]
MVCGFVQGNNCPLAQAYVPPQPYESPSTPEQSLACGTVFPALSMPYTSIFAQKGTKKGGMK